MRITGNARELKTYFLVCCSIVDYPKGNILVSTAGDVKISDFGLAVSVDVSHRSQRHWCAKPHNSAIFSSHVFDRNLGKSVLVFLKKEPGSSWTCDGSKVFCSMSPHVDRRPPVLRRTQGVISSDANAFGSDIWFVRGVVALGGAG